MKASLLAGIFLLAAARHYGSQFFPVGFRGMASKGFGAATILVMMWVLYYAAPRATVQLDIPARWRRLRALFARFLPLTITPLFWVFAWWTFEEAQVLLCSFAYIWRPWEVAPGQAICSALVGLDLGAIGICLVAWILAVNMSFLQGSATTKQDKNDRT